MSAITKTVYLGKDNTFDLAFSSLSTAGVETVLNFAGVYSMTVDLVQNGSVITTQTYTTLTAGSPVDTSPGSGVVRLSLGQMAGLAVGRYYLRLSYKTSSGDTYPTQLTHERADTPVVVVVV